MTTIRQLMQTSPARANELFAKLAETSDNAVKTRERLFTELKEELELLARLEEEHIFPVLRKYKETKKLVPEALDDNRLTRKLLADLERTPRESEEFASKVAELRRTFQQHVRDEKKELLPAVLEALSDEDAQAIVESIEDEKAEIEAARRAEAEQRRAAAREEQEQAENVRQSVEAVADTVLTTATMPVEIVRRTADVTQSGLNTAAEGFRRITERFTEVLGLSGVQAEQVARQSSENVKAVSEASAVLVSGFQEASQTLLAQAQQRLTTNIEGLRRLAQCRSAQDFLALQSELARENMRHTVESSRRIGEVSVRVADEAAGIIESRAQNNADRDRIRRAA